MADDLPLRCLPTMVQGEESSDPPVGGGSPMPTELPEDSEIPTVTPTPAPNPVRQFNEGDIVRWVSGGGWINEGQVQSAELAPDTNRWVYDVLRADKSTWKNLEENRMSLVVDGVSPPYQPRVEGLPVRAYQLGTDIVVAEGIVVSGEQRPEGWMYDIRQADCEIYQTEPGVRTLLIESLTEPVDCEEDGSTSVPTPTPTPTPEPDDPTPTPEPTSEPTEATPTPEPEPTEEPEDTPEPTPEPTEEPTPTPTPEPDDDEEEDEQETNPGSEPYIEVLTESVSVKATSGATGSYAVSGFGVTFRFDDSGDEFYVQGGLIVDHEGQGYWYTQAVSLYSASQPYIDCLGNSRDIWGGKHTTGPGAGCISDAGAITLGETYEIKIIKSLYPNEPYSWNVIIEGLGQSDIGHDHGHDHSTTIPGGVSHNIEDCGDFLEWPPLETDGQGC